MKIQKHLTIEEEKMRRLDEKMKSNGQKFSPLANVLIDKYLEESV